MQRRTLTIILVVVILLALFTNSFFIKPIIEITQTVQGNPGDVNETWFNTSILTVTVTAPTPWITWYDFQNSTSDSKLNTQIDVNEQYQFVVNITQNSSWVDIDYINITAWYDDGDDGSTYNETAGGNINMLLQYENTTGTRVFRMLWPDDEVTFNAGSCIEYSHNASCHNLTFIFTPLYQVRHAQGDGSWSTATNTTDDTYSWNFVIDVYTSSDRSSSVTDEYGIYRYSEISSAGNPTMSGAPGTTATAGAISIVTRANENFSLSVDLNATLDGPGANTMPNTTIGLAGGDLAETNFDGSNPLYVYGGAASYRAHDVNTFERSTSLTYHCDIPLGQFPGQYTSLVYYHLKLDTS